MITLEDYLKRNATEHPDKTAVVSADGFLSYLNLWKMVERRADELKQEHESRIVVFRSSQSADFIVTYFAVHLSGKIAVPLERDVPQRVMDDICRNLDIVEKCGNIPNDVADILFTTGTTGKAKGVMVSHRAIIADAENLIGAQGYSSNLTFIVSGPLNHIGSLSKLYPMIYLSGTISITEGMKDMNAFFSAIENADGKVASFLVPASISMLMRFGEERLKQCADRIDFIETGAAPMPLADMQKLCTLLPCSRLYNTYASTETGIISTFDYNAGECVAGCLGVPMRHSSVVVSADGHVGCSGETLMSGYVGDRELTASVLYVGCMHTSDLGRLDAGGRLHLSGRDGDVVNIGGYKVAPTEVEDAAMLSPLVKDCVCLPASHPVLGTVLRLLVVLTEGCQLDKRQIALCIRQRLEAYKVPVYYEEVEKINRTYNGKIDRKSYTLSK